MSVKTYTKSDLSPITQLNSSVSSLTVEGKASLVYDVKFVWEKR
jgi:hypothetical protein